MMLRNCRKLFLVMNWFVFCFQSQMGRVINSFGDGGIELVKCWVGAGINFRSRDVCML